MHIALIYNRWLIFCLCTCTHWEHNALSQSLVVYQLLLHQMNHSYSLSEIAWLKYSTSIHYMREVDLSSYFSSSPWELISKIKGLSKFPADGAQMQSRSWASIFMTSYTGLRICMSLEVMIPSAWNCILSCGFLVLDHVKNFMIVSASVTWSCLHEKSCRPDHDLCRWHHGIGQFGKVMHLSA